MIRFIISNLIVVFCVIRAVSYAVFTFRERNIAGGIGILVLMSCAVAMNYIVYR